MAGTGIEFSSPGSSSSALITKPAFASVLFYYLISWKKKMQMDLIKGECKFLISAWIPSMVMEILKDGE